MNLVFLLYIMLFSVCDRCDILWCRQELMNLVFLLYIMLFSVCDAVIYCGASGADESSILLYIMLFSVCDRCDICVVPSGADESAVIRT